jgi:hypothetical protein
MLAQLAGIHVVTYPVELFPIPDGGLAEEDSGRDGIRRCHVSGIGKNG